MPVEVTSDTIAGLQDKATRLRIHSVRATTAANSGHPTSCASAAEIMSALFFSVMRYDPANPANPANDVFILSKGHAAPVLYAAWAEAGYLSVDDLVNLRKLDSDLEGHPPTTLPFVDVATGSLGQGICAGVGMALNARLDKRDQRVYVLLGDGETAEGSVWEAAELASHYKLNNLCATVDVNRLGQSAPTMLQHELQTYQARWQAFGWRALVVDGHNVESLLKAYDDAANTTDRPTVVLARTLKGKGVSFTEDKEGYHGKPIPAGEDFDKALHELEGQLNNVTFNWTPKLPSSNGSGLGAAQPAPPPPYTVGGKELATRAAFGAALAALGKTNPRIVALDGDVKNSTHTEDFEKVAPERFFQGFIAEQNMMGAAMGFAARGKIPFAASFACFLARGYDFMRMAAISKSNVKFVGTHAGISIGEDGPSQMGLEDLAMTCAEPNYTVLYPSEATSAWQAIELAAATEGPFYIRTSRPKTPVLYGPEERFEIGRCKIVRQSDVDRVTVVAAGITLFEALKAYNQLNEQGIPIRVIDLFSVRPIDAQTLQASARLTNGLVVTVEDHYEHGGIGDAVLSALATDGGFKVHKLAVRSIARSGQADELLDRFGISARHIVEKVRSLVAS
jgi:transketolase